MRSLIRCGLVHFWVTSLSHLFFHTMPRICSWTGIHSVCGWWLLRRTMLMALTSHKLSRVMTSGLRITRGKSTSTALNILRVSTNSLGRIWTLVRQKSTCSWAAGPRCCPIEIIRCTFALSIYWLSQLWFLSWFWSFHVICDNSTAMHPSSYLTVCIILRWMMLFRFS